jgi:hypothetical protein
MCVCMYVYSYTHVCRSREEVSRMQGRLTALEKLQATAGNVEELEERVKELQLVVQNKDGDLRKVHERVCIHKYVHLFMCNFHD